MDLKKLNNILPYRFDEATNSFILSVFGGSDNDVFKAMINIASFLEEENLAYTILERNIQIVELTDKAKQDNMILKLNRDGEIIYINEYACNVTGYKQDEVLGKNWFNCFIPNEDKENISQLFKKILQQEQSSVHNTNAIICKDNTRKVVAWNNCLLTNDDEVEELQCTGIVS